MRNKSFAHLDGVQRKRIDEVIVILLGAKAFDRRIRGDFFPYTHIICKPMI